LYAAIRFPPRIGPRHLADQILRQHTRSRHPAKIDMTRAPDEDPRLTEVKAVLDRLQRISADPREETPEPAQPERGPARGRLPMAIAAAVVAAAVVVAGLLMFTDKRRGPGSVAGGVRQAPPVAANQTAPQAKVAVAAGGELSLQPPAPPRAAAPRPALEAAIGLLSAGRVQAARKQLLAIASEEAADVAWALARSYDPNFLGTLPAVDAEPNIEEATRWYRAWHAAAVSQGLVTHGVSLERIIGSMR
jgi:hypothetical protein